MDQQMYVATAHGLMIAERAGDAWQTASRGLDGRNVTSVAAQNGTILAGTTNGIFRSDDGGQSWTEGDGAPDVYARFLAFHPSVAGLAFAGAEPAGIFVSHDAGRSWRECPEVARLRDEHGWFLPYSPGAGCVRSFAFHGTRAYAAVEIGGVLRSTDRGETWQLVEGSSGNPDFRVPVPRTSICPDVHYVVVHEDTADVVFAATMRGLYRSTDAGRSWLHLYGDCYIRGLWIDPADHDHLIAGPADDVSVNGQIEKTRDGGWSWQTAATGLPTPWRRACVERFAQVGAELMGVVSDGRLVAAQLASLHWQRILADVPDINAVAGMARVRKHEPQQT